VLERLARERFDVGLAEMYDPCPAAIFHRIGVRAKVGALACPTWASMARHSGIPTFPSFVPSWFINKFLEYLNFVVISPVSLLIILSHQKI
jgi:hypothetical protein